MPQHLVLCALCQEQKPLRDSHIIPEFLYKPLYDNNHTFHIVSVRQDKGNRTKQKGIREKLLCGDCESILSKYERYASHILKGEIPLTYQRDGSNLFFSGIDYKKFKLFQLSILWRASVSSLDMFEKVQLGPHQERLREMIKNGDPGSEKQYGCLMWGLKLTDEKIDSLIMQPNKKRIFNQIAYQFVFGGLMWVYIVSNQLLKEQESLCVIKKDGTLFIQVKDITEVSCLIEFIDKAKKMDRAPKRPI